MGTSPKIKIFETISATLNQKVVEIFSKQESFIKAELEKVETGLQSTCVDGNNIYFLHSASLNLLTKAEQILTYYLNEKGYEVLSSLENTKEEDDTLLERLQKTDDLSPQAVEKLLRRSKHLIRSRKKNFLDYYKRLDNNVERPHKKSESSQLFQKIGGDIKISFATKIDGEEERPKSQSSSSLEKKKNKISEEGNPSSGDSGSNIAIKDNQKQNQTKNLRSKTKQDIVTKQSTTTQAFHNRTKPPKYSCNICTFNTSRNSHFSRHLTFHEKNPNMKIYQCNECSYSTTRTSCLTHHIAVSHATTTIKCKNCEYKTLDIKHLKKHIRIVHSDNTKKRTNQKLIKPKAQISFKCPKCIYISKSYHFFVRHLKQHTTKTISKKDIFFPSNIPLVNEFQCPQCPYRTTSKTRFMRHKSNAHNESRPHVCNECGMSFKRSDALKAHLETHLDDEEKKAKMRHRCGVCSLSFRSPAHLRIHGSKHSDAKPFECDACKKYFKSKQSLKKHEKNIHGEPKKHHCSSCQRTFKTKSNLQRHEKLHNREIRAVKERKIESPAEETLTGFDHLEPEDVICGNGEGANSDSLLQMPILAEINDGRLLPMGDQYSNTYVIASNEADGSQSTEIVFQAQDNNVITTNLIGNASVIQTGEYGSTYLFLTEPN